MILIDTHVVLWLALSPERLSTKAKAVIAENRNGSAGIGISPISLYEIGFIESRNRIRLNTSVETFLDRASTFFKLMPITALVALEAVRLAPPFPGDPMDRIIAATALIEGIPLITADERIRRAGVVRTIW